SWVICRAAAGSRQTGGAGEHPGLMTRLPGPPMRAIMVGSVDLRRPEACSLLLLLTADDGDVLRGHAMQVQVDLGGVAGRGPGRWERRSGPHQNGNTRGLV